jgi:hypothetical protein
VVQNPRCNSGELRCILLTYCSLAVFGNGQRRSDNFSGPPRAIKRKRPGWTTCLAACLAAGLALSTGHANSAIHIDDRFAPCTPSEKFIQISVTSKKIPATTEAPERRVWILVELPTPDQIQVPVPDSGTAADHPALESQASALKGEIVRLIGELRDIEVGIGKSGTPEAGDPFQFEIQLADLETSFRGFRLVLPVELKAPPTPADDGQTYRTRLCLDYKIEVPKRAVKISVATLNGGAISESLTLAEADTRFAGPDHPEGAIPITIEYSQQDINDARKDPAQSDPEGSVKKDLRRVGVRVFELAVDKKLLAKDGQPLVDDNPIGRGVAAELQGAIVGLYNLNRLDAKINWGIVESNVGIRETSPTSPWIVQVSGLQLAQSVDVEIIKSPAEARYDDTPSEKKLDAKRVKTTAELRTRRLSLLSAKPGHIISTKDIADDQDRLSKDKNVKSAGELSSGAPPPAGAPQPQALIFLVTGNVSDRFINYKIGGGYSPEENGTAHAGIEEQDMLRFSETASLDYTLGPEVQRIRFKLDRPFDDDGTAGWHFTKFAINVQYFADKDQRLGNLTQKEIEDRETGSEARLSLKYDSFSFLDRAAADCLENVTRKRTRFYFQATPVLGYRDVNLKVDSQLFTIAKIDRSLLPQARTRTTTVSTDISLAFIHDFRDAKKSGLGKLNISLTGRAQRGLHAFGADYKYNKFSATVSSELLFGFLSWRDLFIRHNHIAGSGTRGTPIFELFRLGGAQNVRGIEEGEVIGRKISADQIELGLNAQVIRHWITGKPVSAILQKGDCGEDGAPKPPIDLNNAFLKIFYDRGRISDPDSFVLPGGINRLVHGYGAAFELRALGGQNLNLSIGYARSAQSVLHKSGTLFTGVSFSF